MRPNTIPSSEQEKLILTKIRMLPPEKFAEIIDFVDFVSQKNQEQQRLQAAAKMAEDAFKKVWNNVENDVYGQL